MGMLLPPTWLPRLLNLPTSSYLWVNKVNNLVASFSPMYNMQILNIQFSLQRKVDNFLLCYMGKWDGGYAFARNMAAVFTKLTDKFLFMGQ